jgi:hypothetical protein
MFPAFSREPLVIAPVNTTIFALTLNKTDGRIKGIIAELSVTSHIAEDIEGVNLMGLFGVDDGLKIMSEFLLSMVLAFV